MAAFALRANLVCLPMLADVARLRECELERIGNT
jgi:hypothetical protein